MYIPHAATSTKPLKEPTFHPVCHIGLHTASSHDEPNSKPPPKIDYSSADMDQSVPVNSSTGRSAINHELRSTGKGGDTNSWLKKVNHESQNSSPLSSSQPNTPSTILQMIEDEEELGRGWSYQNLAEASKLSTPSKPFTPSEVKKRERSRALKSATTTPKLKPITLDFSDIRIVFELSPATQWDVSPKYIDQKRALEPLSGDQHTTTEPTNFCDRNDIGPLQRVLGENHDEESTYDCYETRLLLIQLRTLLMRCAVLQSTAQQLERTPWIHEDTRTPPYHDYYVKIRKFSHRALRIAKALRSRSLQARCQYWAGRGCGGLRYWKAARKYFELAIKLDVENDVYPNSRVRPRGLRTNEKADVKFLLDSVSARHDQQMQKVDAVAAEFESRRTGRDINEILTEYRPDSPPWLPDQDRAVYITKREYESEKSLGKGSVATDLKGENIDASDCTRISLSAEERDYIQYGYETTAQRRERRTTSRYSPHYRKLSDCPTSRNRNQDKTPLSQRSSSHNRASGNVAPEPHSNLVDELEAAKWHSRPPRPDSLYRRLSNPGSLKVRRNVEIESIRTNSMPWQGMVDNSSSGEDNETGEPDDEVVTVEWDHSPCFHKGIQ